MKISEKQFNRTRFADIGSYDAFKRMYPIIEHKHRLSRLIPTKAFGKSVKTNLLTRVIIELLEESGHSAERINVTGNLKDNRETFIDVIGRRRTIGSIDWIPSNATKGIADIMSTVYGIRVGWEIKFGRDRMRKEQKEFRNNLIAAGGYYFIIRNLDDFFKEYDILMNEPKIKLLKEFSE